MATPTILPDFSKLITNLNASGVQSWNPELHTILKGLISSVGQSQEVITGVPGGGIFNITNITGGNADLDYLGNYVARTYNDGDIVIASDGISYMCVKNGTTTPPEPWPGGAIPLTLHAATHKVNGTDPVDVKTLAGYPSNAAVFLNGIGAFTTPTGIVPSAHHITHEPGGSDVLQNAAWTNLANTFIQDQLIQKDFAAFRLSHLSGPVNQRAWQMVTSGDTLQYQPVDDTYTPNVAVPLILLRNGDMRIVGNIIQLGGQIKFPATQSASTDVNTLDDYEEVNLWTPIDASGAGIIITTASGTAVKVGTLVTASFSITMPSTSSGVGITFGGLPYPIEANGDKWGGYFTFTQTGVTHTLICKSNSTSFQIFTTAGVQVPWSTYSAKILTGVLVYRSIN